MFFSCLFSLIFSNLKLSKRLEKFEKINLMRDPFETVWSSEQVVSASLTLLIFNFLTNRFEIFRFEKMSKNKQKSTVLAVLLNLVVSEGPESAKNDRFYFVFTLPHSERHISEEN